jgi:hypothetical protein
VLWQPSADVRACGFQVEGTLVDRQVGYQSLVTAGVFPDHGDTPRDTGLLFQTSLNFAEFDSESTQLDLIVQAPAWAQQPGQAKEETRGAGPWVLPYALIILCIGLGMMVLCRTSRRSDRARPQQYEALKTKD